MSTRHRVSTRWRVNTKVVFDATLVRSPCVRREGATCVVPCRRAWGAVIHESSERVWAFWKICRGGKCHPTGANCEGKGSYRWLEQEKCGEVELLKEAFRWFLR